VILYNKFIKLVCNKDYGKLKRAWFTTFTISPDFVERYILPPLLGLDDDLPKTPSQFETINAILGNKNIDIRFFYDAKMPIEGFKRTTAGFYGVFNDTGLFHPKVILIEFEKCSFLIVGSANLTISGWGRNREAVTTKEIGVRQANQVKAFFDQFTLDLVSVPKSTKPAKPWNLIYKNLPKALQCEEKYLYLWSPYFSSKLESLSKELFPGYEVKIIPDIIDGKIRLSKIPTYDNLLFFQDGYRGQEIMTHAKIWLTPKKICIGSHNFTGAALKDANIEASIIDDVDNDTFKKLTESLKVLVEPEEMTEEELNENSLPKDCYELIAHLEANWKMRTIRIYFVDTEERKLNNHLPWELHLPGNVKVTQTENIHGNCKDFQIEFSLEEEEKCFNALITDRIYYIESKSKIIASGYIEEVEARPEYRSPHRYMKLHDFFLDTLSEATPESSNRTKLSQDGDSELYLEDYNIELRTFGYFEIFEIFIKIKRRLLNFKDNTNLKHAVCFAPNSLRALKVLLENELSSSSSIYNWFIIYEFNSILGEVDLEEQWIKPIKPIKINLSSKDKKFISLVLNLKKGTI